MTTLEEAWRWYECTARQFQLMQRLSHLYWTELPWNLLERDDRFRSLERERLMDEAQFGLSHLEDLAVVVLFSVFESLVRRHILAEVREEADMLSHRALKLAAQQMMEQIAEGSFFRVLQPFKDAHSDLIEEVNQVRRYRNWVAHGRGGVEPENVTPRLAYERLQRFLHIILPEPPTAS
ncbi:MAG TPA: hypothetical protein VH643_15010 [Gemmataceae bacterium]|jgi:hypothetical protein